MKMCIPDVIAEYWLLPGQTIFSILLRKLITESIQDPGIIIVHIGTGWIIQRIIVNLVQDLN